MPLPSHTHTPTCLWIPETAPCLCSFLPNMRKHWLPLIRLPFLSNYRLSVWFTVNPTLSLLLFPACISIGQVYCAHLRHIEKQMPGQDSVSKHGKNHNHKKPRQGWGRGTRYGSILGYCKIQKRFGKTDGNSQAKARHQSIPMSPE